MTGFHVSEGTFLEAPWKAFWFARAYHQGKLHVNKRVTFFILVFTCGQWHDINKLTSTAQAAFSGKILIDIRENWLWKEYIYDKTNSSQKCTKCIDFEKLCYIKVT